MLVKRAYTYRFYPTEEQTRNLAQTFGCVRFVYNWALHKRKRAYFDQSIKLSPSDLSAALPALKDKSERYVVSILVEEDIKSLAPVEQQVGLDVGLKSMVVLSTGEAVDNPKYYARDEKKLARAQRKHAKKKKGSKNRDKARKQVARLHARIADKRRDYQYKLSTRIIRENQTVCVESLSMKGMVKNHCLAKAISDVGWGEFTRQLEYKAKWYGRTFIKIDRFYPSSKTCSACGHILEALTLDVREWVCPLCGVCHDRDINAAVNIHAAGLAVLACGGSVRRELVRVAHAAPGEAGSPHS